MTFGTARALSADDVGAGQHWTLLPLTLGHTMLWRTSEEGGGLVNKDPHLTHHKAGLQSRAPD